MTAHTRFRKLVAVVAGAFLASTALAAATVAPADAGTTRHKHDLSIYKAEKYVKLDTSDLSTFTVSCDSGDYATDGMWMLRSIDKAPIGGDPDDDPYPSGSSGYGDLRDVYVQASYPASDNRSWTFEFRNDGYGDAQLSIYVVCIDGTTQANNGHTHNIGVRFLKYAEPRSTVAQPGYVDRRYWDSSVEAGFTCLPNEYFVAPGFNFSGATAPHRLVGSYASNNGLSWRWEFGTSSDPDQVYFYGKCIDRKVLSNASHRHTLAMAQMPRGNGGAWASTSTNGNQQIIKSGGDWRDVTYACDQDNSALHGYKAAVGMFWMGYNWEHAWFYGMEPRPKIRAFRFYGDWDSEVRIGALCINTRTSNPTS